MCRDGEYPPVRPGRASSPPPSLRRYGGRRRAPHPAQATPPREQGKPVGTRRAGADEPATAQSLPAPANRAIVCGPGGRSRALKRRRGALDGGGEILLL